MRLCICLRSVSLMCLRWNYFSWINSSSKYGGNGIENAASLLYEFILVIGRQDPVVRIGNPRADLIVRTTPRL